ncbi:MAG: sigma-70 family RNA polymerase sigma factor [Fluviicola sp.]|nr:sigma-70 family RNA polymerase sigma factor [Fluviicola sp.]
MQKEKEQKVTSQELKKLYKNWPDIRKFLKSKGCGATEAEDIFQEALLIYVRKMEDAEFELTTEPFHYVKNTCKFLWYNQARKKGRSSSEELPEIESFENDDWLQKELKFQLIEKAMTKIGKQCQQILQLFYGKGWNMTAIAKKVGLRNDKVAKAQKYRCINKVKEQVLELQSEKLVMNSKF